MKRISCAVGVILLFPTLALAQFPTPTVFVEEVEQREIAPGQKFIGTVWPLKTSVVGSAVDGRVEFMIEEGTKVAAGDVLAELKTKTIDLQIAVAQSELELRASELAAVDDEQRQAEARLARAMALRDYAKAKFQRTENLFRSGRAAAREELDENESALNAAIQNVTEAEASVRLVKEGQRLIAENQVKLQQANIEVLLDRKEKYTIKAPFDGYVTRRFTEKGAWIQSGNDIAEVIELDEAEIRVDVPEKYISDIQIGNQPLVIVRALREQGPLTDGKVARIVQQADFRSRSFPVIVRMTNPNNGDSPLLKAGMLAEVTLSVGKSEPVLLVSKDALVLGSATDQVFVVETDAQGGTNARAVAVRVGAAVGGKVEVQGLTAGQKVVVRGNERLRPGPVRVGG